MRKKHTTLLVAISVLTLLIVLMLAVNSVRRSAHIHLPQEEVQQDAESGGDDGSAIAQLTVNAETVQSVIETLHRSEQYSRTVTVERFWTGGSGVVTSTVAVCDGWTRIDSRETDGTLRHSLSDGTVLYLWYDEEETAVRTVPGEFTSDDELGIPTYEDLLALPAEQITLADFRSYGGACIYVETQRYEGERMCWWVSVSTGLLTAAQRYEGEQLVYRMSAAENADEIAREQFLLPDGSAPTAN